MERTVPKDVGCARVMQAAILSLVAVSQGVIMAILGLNVSKVSGKTLFSDINSPNFSH